MTNTRFTGFAVTAALIGGAVLGIAVLMGGSSPASAKSLLSTCDHGTRSQVLACCNSYIRKNGKPVWMQGRNDSCTSHIICKKNYKGECGMTQGCVYTPGKPCDTNDGGNDNNNNNDNHGNTKP